jgi:hypothetical protein
MVPNPGPSHSDLVIGLYVNVRTVLQHLLGYDRPALGCRHVLPLLSSLWARRESLPTSVGVIRFVDLDLVDGTVHTHALARPFFDLVR